MDEIRSGMWPLKLLPPLQSTSTVDGAESESLMMATMVLTRILQAKARRFWKKSTQDKDVDGKVSCEEVCVAAGGCQANFIYVLEKQKQAL